MLVSPACWAPDRVLPAGIHTATLDEVEATFCHTDHRKWLFDGLMKSVAILEDAGCRRIYLGGSFVTSKSWPGDYDGCWDPTGVTAADLDQCFIDMPACRAMQKLKYRGELWQGRHDLPFLDALPRYFQQDTRTGAVRGLIEIHLK